jgi:hypothetical protein
MGEGRGAGESLKSFNGLLSPSPSSPPTKGGEILLFTGSSNFDLGLKLWNFDLGGFSWALWLMPMWCCSTEM